MSRSRLAGRLGAVLAVLAHAVPVRVLAAEHEFHWSADTAAGYTGNVFYSEGNDRGSFGGAVRAYLGWAARTPRSDFDATYSPDYYWYDRESDANNLGHALTANWRFKQSERLEWRAGGRGIYSEEQQYRFQDAAEGVTVTQRARRTNWEADSGVAIRTTERMRLDVGAAYGQLHHGTVNLENATSPLVDGDHYRASLGAFWQITPVGHLFTTYTYTGQTFDPNEFIDNEFDASLDLNDDGTIADTTYILSDSTTNGLEVGYGWQISEKTFGTAGAGMFRTHLDALDRTDSNWGVNASITQQFTPKVSGQFGASRDVSSFYGLGGTAVGEVLFTTWTWQTGRDSSLISGANWTRREDIEDTSAWVRTAVLRSEWSQRIGRWGGYFIAYDLVDQEVDQGDPGTVRTTILPDDRNVRFDVIGMGLFFGRGSRGTNGAAQGTTPRSEG